MRQALHIFKKDLRSLWLALAMLYAVLALHTAYALRDPLEREEIRPALSLPFVFILTVLVMTGMLVQQDTLIGTRAFWQTRPIHRGSLLMAKVLFLACFLVLAFLSAVAVLLSFGLSPEEFFTALLDALLPQVNLLTVSVLLAAVTPNMPAYLLAWIGMLVALQLTQDLGNLVAGLPKVSDLTKDFVWQASILLPGAFLVAHQYWTRRTRRTLAGVVIAFFGVVLVPSLWPWELGGVRLPDLSGQVQIGLNGTAPEGAFLAERESEGNMLIRAEPELLQSLPGRDLEMWALQGELEVGLATRTAFSSPTVHIDAEGISAALQGFHWAGGQRPAAPPLNMKTKGPATFDDLVERPGSLQVEIAGQVFSYRLAGMIPLKAGARLDKGWITALVRHISRDDSQLQIVLGSRRIQVGHQDREFPRVVLVNSSRKEVLVGTSFIRSSTSYTSGFARGYRRTAQEEALVFPAEGEENGLLLDDAWLAQAELALLERVPEGWFHTNVHIPNFRTRDTTFDPRPSSASLE